MSQQAHTLPNTITNLLCWKEMTVVCYARHLKRTYTPFGVHGEYLNLKTGRT